MKRYIKCENDITDYRGYEIIKVDNDTYSIFDSSGVEIIQTYSITQAYAIIDDILDNDEEYIPDKDILIRQQELYDDCIYDFARYSHIPINSISEKGIINTEYTNKMKKNGDYIKITDAYLDGLIDSFNKKSEQSKYRVYIDYRITNGGDYRLIADMV